MYRLTIHSNIKIQWKTCPQVYNSRQVGGGGSWLSCSLLVFLGVWHLDRENSHALQKWPKQNHKHNPEARNDQHTVWTTDVVTTGTFLESSVRQSVVLANTHETKTGLVLTFHRWKKKSVTLLGLAVVQGCWLLPMRPVSHHQECCTVAPVDMLAVEIASIQTGNVRMAVGVSHSSGGLWTLMILYPATSTHDHSVSDFSGDWSTSDHSNCLIACKSASI